MLISDNRHVNDGSTSLSANQISQVRQGWNPPWSLRLSHVSLPEFIFERVLCADAGLPSSSWGPAAGQVLGVPGPAGQVDRLLRRHWDRTGKRDKVSGQRVQRTSVRGKNVRSLLSAKFPLAITCTNHPAVAFLKNWLGSS